MQKFIYSQFFRFKPEELTVNEFLHLKDEIKTSLYDITNELDGSNSAEHGIGLAKKEELKKYSSKSEFELMNLIKKSIDQNNILNPGKVL